MCSSYGFIDRVDANRILHSFRLITAMVTLMILNGCSNNALEHYNGTEPTFNIEEYFNGTVTAWGIIQNHKGLVIKRFDFRMECTWDGDNGVFEEYFDYYDGTTDRRTWYVKKIGENQYEATADDIIGVATGVNNGSAMRWRYAMDIPVGDNKFRIKFDDWMFQMRDNVVINRSYLKKFGITVAELTVFMQKKP